MCANYKDWNCKYIRIITNLKYIFSNPQRNVVRLGEHEIGSKMYGPHKDVEIALILSHENFDSVLWINDIAMIYLDQDVEFTGFNCDFFWVFVSNTMQQI